MTEFGNKNIIKKAKVAAAYLSKYGYKATIAEIKKRLKDIYYPDIIFDIEESENIDSSLHFMFLDKHIYIVLPKLLNQDQKSNICSVCDEIFNKQIYKNLSWNRILDIWWYYGESAIYFDITNPDAQIYIYEPQSTCFEYINKNCDQQNMHKYNNFVVWNKNKSIFWIANNWLWDAKSQINDWRYSNNFSYPETIDIETVINQHNPDSIKMDVEWQEYDICKQFRNNPELLKNITNGIIEFHDLSFDQNKNSLLNFVMHISQLWYKHKYINSKGQNIERNKAKNDWITNLYFYK